MSSLGDMNNLRKELRAMSKENWKQKSKDRLRKIANKKFKTCFIGAISDFEKTFGEFLWGFGLPEEELTSEQKTNKEKWQRIRMEILNRGNNQFRGLSSELDLYEISYIGYRINFSGDKNGTN